MCNHKEMYCITNCVCEPVLSKLHAKFMTQFPLPLLTFLEYSSQWGYLCYTWDCSLHTKGFTKQGGDGPQVQCQHWLCRCWSHWCENTAGLCALHAAAKQSVNYTLPQCQVPTLALACTAGSSPGLLPFHAGHQLLTHASTYVTVFGKVLAQNYWDGMPIPCLWKDIEEIYKYPHKVLRWPWAVY